MSWTFGKQGLLRFAFPPVQKNIRFSDNGARLCYNIRPKSDPDFPPSMSDKINFETTVFFPQTQSSCHKIYRSCFDSLSWTFSHSHNFFISVTDIIFFTVFSSFPGRFTCKFRRVFVPWRVVDFNWYVNGQLLTDEVIGLTENRWAEMKRMGFLWQAFPLPNPLIFSRLPRSPSLITSATQAID